MGRHLHHRNKCQGEHQFDSGISYRNWYYRWFGGKEMIQGGREGRESQEWDGRGRVIRKDTGGVVGEIERG